MLLLVSVSITAKAENQAAHIHGLATLTLALESGVLEIQFESPAANLIGFEHKAKLTKEKQVVKQTETILKSPKLLFSFVGTHCKPKETTVDISGVMDSERDQHEHHNHLKAHDDSGHSEITARYRFNCIDIKKLDSVSISLFDQFPRIEKINAMWVTEARQGADLLNPNRKTISLK